MKDLRQSTQLKKNKDGNIHKSEALQTNINTCRVSKLNKQNVNE